jgi:hypothetical protein
VAAPLYFHLPHGSSLPAIGPAPFKALLIAESIVGDDWRGNVCEWLARNGCRYFLAWGQDCELWHDVMDETAVAFFGGDDGENFIMTTWHEDEPLAEAMWFSVHHAEHPTVTFKGFVIVHVTPHARGDEILDQFANAAREE